MYFYPLSVPFKALCCHGLYLMERILTAAIFQFGFWFNSVHVLLPFCQMLTNIGYFRDNFSPFEYFRIGCNNSISLVKKLQRLIGIESWMISFCLNRLLFFLLCYSWTLYMYSAIVPSYICLCKLKVPDELYQSPLALWRIIRPIVWIALLRVAVITSGGCNLCCSFFF